MRVSNIPLTLVLVTNQTVHYNTSPDHSKHHSTVHFKTSPYLSVQ